MVPEVKYIKTTNIDVEHTIAVNSDGEEIGELVRIPRTRLGTLYLSVRFKRMKGGKSKISRDLTDAKLFLFEETTGEDLKDVESEQKDY